jgi:hypothetical protein
LCDDDFDLFTKESNFGDIFINYCDVGKRIEDIYRDNDTYINDDAFVSYVHYTADCLVQWYDVSKEDSDRITKEVWDFFDKFNVGKNYTKYDKKITIGRPPVASLSTTKSKSDIFDEIVDHQHILDFNFV